MKYFKKIIKNISKKSPLLLVLGILLVLSLLQLFGIAKSIASQLVKEPSQKIAADLQNTCYKGDQIIIPTHITIDKAKIDLPVSAVALDKNGEWPVLDGVANYAVETSPISRDGGNVGIYAHNKENGFTRIKILKKGDAIKIKGGEYQAEYVVTSTSIVNATQVDTFFPTQAPTLTLITCEGAFSQQRFVVKAALANLTKGSCNEVLS